MGFSHETTAHHFILLPDGGMISVEARCGHDDATREQIRMHLAHITKMFSAGDFDLPMFIHDTNPPGAATMSRLREQVEYRLKETPQGATIRISSKNHEAVEAIHQFLRFQINDHKTGDPVR